MNHCHMNYFSNENKCALVVEAASSDIQKQKCICSF